MLPIEDLFVHLYVPEGLQLLVGLARDPGRRLVVVLPVRRPGLRPPDATAEEATWMMAGP
jgi:hypothetical protein